MAVTVLKVFEKAMDKIDERLSNGQIDANSTAEYKARSYGIISALQNEITRIKPFKKTVTYTTWDLSPTFGEYSLIDLPTDFDQSVLIEVYPTTDETMAFIDETDKLNVLTEYKGSVKLTYSAIPPDVTSDTDTLVVSDILANTCIVYGLVAELMATDDPDLSNYYSQKYEESKVEIREKSKAKFVKSKNAYRVGW